MKINTNLLKPFKILWQNPSPTNAFPSSGDTGTITLESDDYDFILWVCASDGDFSEPRGCFLYFKGQQYINFSQCLGQAGIRLLNVFRYVNIIDDKTFSISRCYRYQQQGETTSLTYTDKALLPLYALGFKM